MMDEQERRREMREIAAEIESAVNLAMETHDSKEYGISIRPVRNLAGGVDRFAVTVTHAISVDTEIRPA